VVSIKEYKRFSRDGYVLLKRSYFLALLLECIAEKKNIDLKKLYKKLEEIERIWNLDDNTPEFVEFRKGYLGKNRS